MNRRRALVGLLADGELHSGEALARELGVTRAAVATQLRGLADWGLVVESVPRRGYKLPAPIDFVDAARLELALNASTRARLDRLEVVDELESTNARLLSEVDLAPGRFRVCLAEFQSAGRGRRGRAWIQPFGGGLCLSFAWSFASAPPAPGSLSLVAGIATLRALGRHGITGLSLKWPNDVLLGGAKLGGILSELRLEAAGSAYVVIGLGLNVRLSPQAQAAIAITGGLPAADLSRGPVPDRTLLAAALVDELCAAVSEYETRGFAPFAAEWSGADALRDRPVRVHLRDSARDGVARGIGADGALKVEIAGRLETLSSGEVTLRAVA